MKYIIILFVMLLWIPSKGQVNVDSIFFDLVDTLQSSKSSREKIKKRNKVSTLIIHNFSEELTDTIIQFLGSNKANLMLESFCRSIIRKNLIFKESSRKKIVEAYIRFYANHKEFHYLDRFMEHEYPELKPKDFTPEAIKWIDEIFTWYDLRETSYAFFIAGYSGKKKYINILRNYLEKEKITPQTVIKDWTRNAHFMALCALARLGDNEAARLLVQIYEEDSMFFFEEVRWSRNKMPYFFYTRNKIVYEGILRKTFVFPGIVSDVKKEFFCKMTTKYKLCNCPDMDIFEYTNPGIEAKYRKFLKRNSRRIKRRFLKIR